ncbi:hypothetical protein SAMN05661008_01793 [Alkalithermobacter thermoalcaliphilus JW-YL-7 = DSM 7308]|uniref:Uncharacterized protein n=1 Tax=Alkalithermobacter thermoalcaliphilus JW-YL-7 = DSM 7308 TaxID=1121328 RepID=A0A150FMZ6_CLOPD|nr:hypothetical protein JWYL7_0029 [[Clostridium] paradoxum JW-YL-7 = DSM 7308]SHL27396.1 hypothetical protein SAMN05661008_01793 [[Clostridium] paradoxum JW-YL-7 = DSM 7308]
MNKELEEVKIELKSICEQFTNILKRLESENVITKEEFIEYSSKKIEFLNS